MNIVLSDFDGTVTTHDSLKDFLIYAVGYKTFILKMLPVLPWLIGYLLKIADNQKVKVKVVKQFFKGINIKDFNVKSKEFALKYLDTITRPHVIAALRKHKAHGDRVIIVSASISSYLQPWCDKEGFELISTNLEVVDEKITGNFSTPNVWGPEKVSRIKAYTKLENLHEAYEKVYVYGDKPHGGDKEMLLLADEPHIIATKALY